MREHQEGDTVTVTATGLISQKTTSGYIVTIHGVDVPFVWINRGAPVAQQQELAQQILEWIERTEQEIHQDLEMLGPDSSEAKAYQCMNRLTVLKNDIKELCQKEVGHDATT